MSEIDDLIAVLHENDVRRQNQFDLIAARYQLTDQIAACFTEISARYAEQLSKAETPQGREIAAQAVSNGMVSTLLTGVLGIAKAHSDCGKHDCLTCQQIKFALIEATAYATWLARQTVG